MLVPAFTDGPPLGPTAPVGSDRLDPDSGRAQIAVQPLDGIALRWLAVQLAESPSGTAWAAAVAVGGSIGPLLQAQAHSTGLRVRRPAHLGTARGGVAGGRASD